MRIVALALWIAVASPAQARPVQVLHYQDAIDQSDLVAIATPLAKTVDTAERGVLPNIFHDGGDGKLVPIAAIGVETPFEVAAVLKGDKAIARFVLHHYREARFPEIEVNGPMLLSFDPAPSTSGSYLMFLIREPDGRFAPVGGQTDPGIQSVLPLPREFK